jgi:hypothetical protein
MDLAEFLFTRIGEDKAAAQAAGGVAWRRGQPNYAAEWGATLDAWSSDYIGVCEAASGDVVVYDEGAPDEDQAEHIARWDPKRVLLECEARRERLELHKPVAIEFCDLERQHPSEHETRLACSACGMPAEYPVWWPCDTIRTDLAVYADHPDFQPDWRLT